jgi:hypothetical protein
MGRFHLESGEYEVKSPRPGEPYLAGHGLTVDLGAPEPSLLEARRLNEIAIDLPPARLPRLASFERVLPKGTGIEILSGKGTIEAHVALHGKSDSPAGQVALEADGVRVRRGDLDLRGRLSTYVDIPSPDLDARGLDVAGIRFALRGEASGLPKWLEIMHPLENAHGQLDVLLDRGSLFIDNFRMNAGPLDVLARFRTEGGDLRGGVLMRVAGNQVGLDIQGGETKIEILDAAGPYARMALARRRDSD